MTCQPISRWHSFVNTSSSHPPSLSPLCVVSTYRREQERKAAELAEAEEREKHVLTRNYKIYTLNEMYKTTVARSKQIVDWFQNGGVMLMGYEMYRLLVSHKVCKLQST